MPGPPAADPSVNHRTFSTPPRRTLRAPAPLRRPRFYLGLLLLTVVTTFWTGVNLLSWGIAPPTLHVVLDAFTFPAALLTVLLAHELGHFVACRRHRLNASLPMFLPGPPFPIAIGTFGAFIRIRSPLTSRAQLLDIGATGPLAGFVPAVLLLIAGLRLSVVAPLPGGESFLFGESLLVGLLRRLIIGPIPDGYDVYYHPIALAAWLGLFVTSLNLLMAGQLDGGHVVRALFGRRHRLFSRSIFVALVTWGMWGDPLWGYWWAYPYLLALPVWALVLSWRPLRHKLDRNIFLLLTLSYILLQMIFEASSASSLWLVWGLLIYLFGLDHPPVHGTARRLSPFRLAVGAACLLVFVLTFMPLPITLLSH